MSLFRHRLELCRTRQQGGRLRQGAPRGPHGPGDTGPRPQCSDLRSQTLHETSTSLTLERLSSRRAEPDVSPTRHGDRNPNHKWAHASKGHDTDSGCLVRKTWPHTVWDRGP